MKTGPKPRLINERYSIDDSTGCWLWKDAVDHDGYGVITVDRRQLRANRFVAHLYFGFDLNSNLLICHKCDNPPCVNPEHLFVGTPSDNMQDSVRKGRNFCASKIMCKRGHDLNKDNVLLYKNTRYCRVCRRIRERGRSQRRGQKCQQLSAVT